MQVKIFAALNLLKANYDQADIVIITELPLEMVLFLRDELLLRRQTVNDPIYTWHSKVRDYELDALGIVNHATYINYMEQCRNDYARDLGVDFIEYYHAGYSFVVAGIDIQYRSPLTAKEEFYVTVELAVGMEKQTSKDKN